MARAKGKDELYREDIVIYTVRTAAGYVHYLLEREPFESEGLKKSVFVHGRVGYDAVFQHREDAEAALARFPSRPPEEPEADEPAAEKAGAAAREAGAE